MKSISSRLLLIMIVISTIGMGVVTAAGVFLSSGSIYEQSLLLVSETAERKSVEIDSWFQQGIGYVNSLAVHLSNHTDLSPEALSPFLVRHGEENPQYDSIYAGFPDGFGVFSDGWEPDYNDWQANKRPWYQGAVANPGRIFISDLYKDAQTGQLCITFSRTFEIDGQIAGVVAVDAYLDTLETLISNYNINGGYAFLTDDSGRVMLHHNRDYIPYTDANEDTLFHNAADIGDDGFVPLLQAKGDTGTVVSVTGADGIGRYYAAAEVPANGWLVFTSIPVSMVRTPIYEQIFASAGLYILILLAASALIYVTIKRLITRPVKILSDTAKELSKGNLNINTDKRTVHNDEIGALTLEVYALTDVIKEAINDLSQLKREYQIIGNTEYRIDTAKYNGSYKELTGGMNDFVDTFSDEIQVLLDVIEKIGDGDFNIEIKELPGDKIVLNQMFNNVLDTLKSIKADIENLALTAAKGDLSVRADANKYKGDWALLLNELNALVSAVADKAYWYEALIDAVPFVISAIDNDMNLTYVNKYGLGMLKMTREEAIGKPCNIWQCGACGNEKCGVRCVERGESQSEYIWGDDQYYQITAAEIKNAQGKRVGYVEIDQDVSPVKAAMAKLSRLMVNIEEISRQVSQDAKQISESSQDLAQGATTQASAIEELNATIDTINQQIQTTAQNAANADSLTKDAQQNAVSGNEEMHSMLSSMESIKDASGNISKIIKTIEDIAFQTNLLALNAAVEAARAGEHGKGFSVVAEEVRTLAGRSHVSANETNKLITDTISKVDEGMKVALKTAESFEAIVSGFENVSKVIAEIAAASTEQAESIGQIVIGVSQISDITQSNSAASEETAAAAQELSEQSETLVGLFKDM